MDDDQSTNDIQQEDVQQPETDAIESVLSDTEDRADTPVEEPEQSQVDETPDDNEESESEATAEAEQEDEGEDLQPELDPKEEARRRYEERQRAQAEREARVQKVTEEHIKGAEDEYDQRLRAMEAQKYKETVEHTENTLITEFERAKANPDLQIFNPENKEQFNEKAYEKAMRDYNAGYIVYDENGNMVGTKGSLFEHLTETAELLKGAVKSGAVQQVRATQKMRSSADTKPAAQPKESAKDPILDTLLSD